MGLLWYTNRMYSDFILKIDWKVKRRSDNSGVFIRFADAWNAVKTGYEIQIDDLALPDRPLPDRPRIHTTGEFRYSMCLGKASLLAVFHLTKEFRL